MSSGLVPFVWFGIMATLAGALLIFFNDILIISAILLFSAFPLFLIVGVIMFMLDETFGDKR